MAIINDSINSTISSSGSTSISLGTSGIGTNITYLTGMEYTTADGNTYFHYYTTDDFYNGKFIDDKKKEHELIPNQDTTKEYRLINSETQQYIVLNPDTALTQIPLLPYKTHCMPDTNIIFKYQYQYKITDKNSHTFAIFRAKEQGPISKIDLKVYTSYAPYGQKRTIYTSGSYDMNRTTKNTDSTEKGYKYSYIYSTTDASPSVPIYFTFEITSYDNNLISDNNFEII